MANDKSAKIRADTQQNESVVAFLVRIVKEDGAIIKEDRLGLLEGDSVLPLIRGALAWIPFESNVRHRVAV